MKRLVLIILILLMASGSATATNRYVGTTSCSDSGAGTDVNNPWCKISYAVGWSSATVAGDTVYVKAGTYTDRVQFGVVGSAGSYITVTNYQGGLVIVDGTTVNMANTWEALFDLTDTAYINASNITVKNSNQVGLTVIRTNHFNINNVSIYNTSLSGVVIGDNSHNGTFTNSEINRCGNSTRASQECLSISDNNYNLTITGNKVHDVGNVTSGGEGIDVKQGANNTIVCNNTVWNMTSIGIYIDAFAGNNSDITVCNNVVHNVNSSGIGVGAEETGTSKNISVYNNIVYNNSYSGFILPAYQVPGQTGYVKNVSVYNNVFYYNGVTDSNHGGIYIANNWLGTVISNVSFVNNIVDNNTGFTIKINQGTNITVDYNVVSDFKSSTNETNGTHYQSCQPTYGTLWSLTGTCGIDQGTNTGAPTTDYLGVARPQNGVTDIGAYELIPLNSKTLAQINASVNNDGTCGVDVITYIEPQTQTTYTYTCSSGSGQSSGSISVKYGEGMWMHSTVTKNIARSW